MNSHQPMTDITEAARELRVRLSSATRPGLHYYARRSPTHILPHESLGNG